MERVTIGNGVFYHGDCFDVMRSLPDGCVDEDGGDEGCGCGTCHHETKAEAIAAWNRRAGDPQ